MLREVPRDRPPRRARAGRRHRGIAGAAVAALVVGGAASFMAPAAAAGSSSPSVRGEVAAAPGEPVRPTPAAPARPAVSQAKFVPVTGARLSARFGAKGLRWKSGRHTGLDFAARTGTPVRAARHGTVVFVGWAGRYGKAVVVRHANGERTRYAHLSRTHARKGQRVHGGQVIGRVGSTGNSTGPHLHFEVLKRSGGFTDPHRWLRAA